MADAWHHRSDALSSIGALVGIAGARMGYPILDAIASLVICIFIEKAAIDIFKDAINKMVEMCIRDRHYGDPSAWLDGTQWDTVMNYDAFMEPILSLIHITTKRIRQRHFCFG